MDAIRRLRDLWRRIGPRAVDVGSIVVSLLTAGGSTWGSPRWVDLPVGILVAAGLLGSVSLWWRRQRPVAVTFVGIVVHLLSGNPVPMIVGLFTVAVVRRDRLTVAVAAAIAAALAVPDLVRAAHPAPGMVISAIAGAAFVVAVGAYVGARRDLVASLVDRAERAESERELRSEQARTAERARIAREMHDVLAHKVSLIALHAGALEVNADISAERVEAAASLIRTTAHQTLEELREVLGVLRTESAPDGTDLAPNVTESDLALLVESSRSAGLAVELEGSLPGLPDATARAVHRVVQEGLTNVLKHARGATTEVALAGDPVAGVSVSVVNRRPVAADLIGDPVPGSGAGLLGLEERVRLLGGTFASGADPDGGWALRAWLPWGTVVIEPSEMHPVDERGEVHSS